MTGAPRGARIQARLYQRVEDQPTFLRTLFGADLGESLASVPPVALDLLPASAGNNNAGAGTKRATLTVGLLSHNVTGPGNLGLSRGLGGAGAYPLAVDLVDAKGSSLNQIVTHLVRLPAPDAEVAPLRVALVVPVHAPPTTSPGGATSRLPARVVRSVAATALALRAHPSVPVSVAATPETVDALARQGGDAASALDSLRRALAGRQLIAEPYVDVRLSDWVDAGLSEELTRLRDRGTAALTARLKRPDGRTFLLRGPLTRDAARLMRLTGVDQVVADPGATSPDSRSTGGAPPARLPYSVETGLATPLVVIDSSEGALLTQRADPVLAAHRLLADLVTIWQSDPGAARGVVVAPGPDWQVAGPDLEAVLAGLTAGGRVVRPTTLAGLFDGLRSEGARRPRPSGNDLDGYPASVQAARRQVASFASLLPKADPLPAALDQRLDVSAADDLRPAQRLAYPAAVLAAIGRRTAAIDAPARQTVTLTARDTDLPVVVRNRLSRPIDVVVTLEAGSRLEFPLGATVSERLEPGTQRFRIRVRARSPGTSPLLVRVTSPDGGIVLATTRYTVRSTAVSGLGAALSIGALLFLLLWWARHWRRSRRTRRAGPQAPTGGDGEPRAAPAGTGPAAAEIPAGR
ncbi:MAG: hypothetical protein HYX34_09150 [Actinobacteria bacterium]|nr:hypothetical protein [Actinomycetota bacterium]